MLTILYLVFTALLVATGLTMVALATWSFLQTDRTSMLLLAVGFSVIVAAAMATMASAFLMEFRNTELTLLVNNAVMAAGFAFIVASLVVE